MFYFVITHEVQRWLASWVEGDAPEIKFHCKKKHFKRSDLSKFWWLLAGRGERGCCKNLGLKIIIQFYLVFRLLYVEFRFKHAAIKKLALFLRNVCIQKSLPLVPGFKLASFGSKIYIVVFQRLKSLVNWSSPSHKQLKKTRNWNNTK